MQLPSRFLSTAQDSAALPFPWSLCSLPCPKKTYGAQDRGRFSVFDAFSIQQDKEPSPVLCGVFDVKEQSVILQLDFDFDIGYMFNECFVDNDILIFDDHLAGEGKDLITAYDLHEKKYLLHQEENTERTYNGEKTLTVKNEETGMDIIVF